MRLRAARLLVLPFAVACAGGPPPSKAPRTTAPPDASVSSIGRAVLEKGGFRSGAPRETASRSTPAGPLRLEWLESPVNLDGALGEWPARSPARCVQGSTATTFGAALQYDEQNVYLAGEILAPAVAANDHASFAFAFPGPGGALAPYEIDLRPGTPGERAGEVTYASGLHKGRSVAGAEIVEDPVQGGLSFEAKIPWSTFPEARLVRVGLRGSVLYHDGGSVLATGESDLGTPARWPELPTEPEISLREGLLAPNSLPETPTLDLIVDASGDLRRERISVYGHVLTILGPGYRNGREFFFRNLGAEVISMEAKDVTGGGKAELILRKRTGDGTRHEFVEVLSLAKSDEPSTVFSHEISISSGTRRISNSVHFAPKEIEVLAEPAVGWNDATFNEAVANDSEPILLPWGDRRSQRFTFDGARFVRVASLRVDETRPSPPPAHGAPEPSSSHDRAGGPSMPALLEQFRRDRGGAPIAPRKQMLVNVAGDARTEQVFLIGQDLVVMGPGFRNGTSYAYVTLAQFSDPSTTDLTARDLTGDGSSELIVRGTATSNHAVLGAVESEMITVYAVVDGALRRVFAAEISRKTSGGRIQGVVQFLSSPTAKSSEIELRPGKAERFTQKNAPWAQERPGSGTVEPLLLPWGGISRLRYAWDGTTFRRKGD